MMTWEQIKILFEVADHARYHGQEFVAMRNQALALLRGVVVEEIEFAGGYEDGEGHSE
jgi:hypothetical protein